MGERSNLHECDLKITDHSTWQIYSFLKTQRQNENDYYKYVTVENNNVLLDIDYWKIHGYWYKDFCNWMIELQKAKIRGVIYLDLYGQDYNIYLRDEGVFVAIGVETDYIESLNITFKRTPDETIEFSQIIDGMKIETADIPEDIIENFKDDNYPTLKEIFETLTTKEKEMVIEELKENGYNEKTIKEEIGWK
jgi:hypothetical protein